MTARPTLWLLAGADGVGKTTYAYRHIRAVSGSVHFINLDEIARDLSPLDPEVARVAAARAALNRAREMMAAQTSFSIETTLAGKTHLRTIAEAHASGFAVTLLYFAVKDIETCASRIARRVSEGGHDIPPSDLQRRFERSIANFNTYAAAVDLWHIFDNNNGAPRVVAEGRQNCRTLQGDVASLPTALTLSVGSLASYAEGGS